MLSAARQKVNNSINAAMVDAYWNIGKRIFEEEQQGQERADYGVFLIKELSRQLIEEFGKGFDERELRRMRQFYQTFSIRGALRPELSWTHYRIILRVDNPSARQYYITETADQSWSTASLNGILIPFIMNGCSLRKVRGKPYWIKRKWKSHPLLM